MLIDYFAILCSIEKCKYIIPINLALNVYPNPSFEFHLLFVKNVASKNSSKASPGKSPKLRGLWPWRTDLANYIDLVPWQIWLMICFDRIFLSHNRFDWWFDGRIFIWWWFDGRIFIWCWFDGRIFIWWWFDGRFWLMIWWKDFYLMMIWWTDFHLMMIWWKDFHLMMIWWWW